MKPARLCLLLGLATAGQLQVTVTPDSKVVRVETSYSFQVVPSTAVPANGAVQVQFPGEFPALPATLTCSLTTGSVQVSSTCDIQGNKVSAVFPSAISGFPTPTRAAFALYGVVNPAYALTSSSFTIYTLSEQGNVLDQPASAVTVTFEPAELVSAGLFPGSQRAGDYSIWTVSLTTRYSLAQGDFIQVLFPRWDQAINPSPTDTLYALYAITVTCTSGSLQVAQDCLFSNNLLTVRVAAIHSAGFGDFLVASIRNPPLAGQTVGFALQTGTSVGLLESKSAVSVSTSEPASFPLSLKPTSRVVNVLTSYEFAFTSPLPIPAKAVFIVSFPVQIALKSPTLQTLLSLSSTAVLAVSASLLTITEGYSKYSTALDVVFILSGIVNPPSARPTSDQIKLTIRTESGETYETSSPGVTFTATSGGLSDLSISPANRVINAATEYRFAFTMGNSVPATGGVLVKMPVEVRLNPGSQCISSTGGLSSSMTCAIESNEVLKVRNAFKDSQTARSVSITVNQVTNPASIKPTSPFLIQTYEDSDFLYVIDSDQSVTIAAVSAVLQSFTIEADSYVTGVVTKYTFTVVTSSPIPQNGRVSIVFPDDFVISNPNVPCKPVTGYETNLACSIQGQVLSTTAGLDKREYAAGRFGLSLDLVKNPTTTKPSGGFNAATYTADGLVIDQTSSGISIAMTSPNAFLSAGVVPSSYQVGVSTTLTFTLTPNNPVYPTSIILIQPPNGLSFPSPPSCSITSSSTTSQICTLSNAVLRVSLSLSGLSTQPIQLQVLNFNNPKSRKPTDSFTITTTLDTYLIDRKADGLILTMQTPGPLTGSVIPGVLGIGVVADYEFQVTLTNFGPVDGYLYVVLPVEVAFTQTTRATDSRGNAISAVFTAPRNAQISLFSSSLGLTFTLTSLKNGSSASLSSPFSLSTATSEGFSIDSGQALGVTFTCYSPCATCSSSPDTCLSCLSASSQAYFYDGVCNAACKVGWYSVSIGVCGKCSINCLTCVESQEKCTSCLSNGSTPYLSRNQCMSLCPSNQYVGSGLVCQDCDSACLTCRGQGSGLCTSCVSSMVLYKGQCLPTCPTSTVLMNKECIDCDQPCATCLSTPSFCQSCPSGKYLHSGTCVSSCPVEVTVQIDTMCKGCDSACVTCRSQPSTCTSCTSEKLLYNSQCVSMCLPGFYSDSGACKVCSPECVQCTSTSDNCIACKVGQYLYLSRCVSGCPTGTTIPSGSNCIPCLSTCKACSQRAEYCTSCPSGSFLSLSSCVPACPDLYYPNGQVCERCAETCQSCLNSSTNCQSCQLGFYLYAGQCVAVCPALSTVTIGAVCLRCKAPCLTCTGAVSACLSCGDGLVALAGSCVAACPTGYSTVDGVCLVDELPPGQCAKGCTSEKLQNSLCDPECNVQACGYDNSRCTSTPPTVNDPQIPLPSPPNPLVTPTQPSPVYLIPKYSAKLQVQKVPFPASAVSALSIIVLTLAKAVFPGMSVTSALVGVTSSLSAAANIALCAVILSIEDIHGKRELLAASDVNISGVFGAIVVVLTVHYVVNAAFVYVYVVWIARRDAVHAAWRTLHPVSARICLVFACLFSFKALRLMSCNLLQRDYLAAGYLRKARLSHSMLLCVYISLVGVNLPIIALCGYILGTYSTGNVAFIVALDCLIVNFEDLIVSFLLILVLRRELRSEQSKFELPRGIQETQDTAIADLEQVHIEVSSPTMLPTRTPSEGTKYFDSDRDVYEADKRLEVTFSHKDSSQEG